MGCGLRTPQLLNPRCDFLFANSSVSASANSHLTHLCMYSLQHRLKVKKWGANCPSAPKNCLIAPRVLKPGVGRTSLLATPVVESAIASKVHTKFARGFRARGANEFWPPAPSSPKSQEIPGAICPKNG